MSPVARPTTTRCGTRSTSCLATACRRRRIACWVWISVRSATSARAFARAKSGWSASSACTKPFLTPCSVCWSRALLPARPRTPAAAACIKANMPCRGCYGPPDGVVDQGAAMLDAVVAGLSGQTDAEIRTPWLRSSTRWALFTAIVCGFVPRPVAQQRNPQPQVDVARRNMFHETNYDRPDYPP